MMKRDKFTDLYIIRHCEAVGNRDRTFQGISDCDITELGQRQLECVAERFKDIKPDAIVVAAGYADAHRVGAVSPWDIPKIARDAGADLAMLDTAVKDGKTLFDYLDIDDLKKFTDEGHEYGLKVALAGSVKKDQLKPLNDIGCDVVGLRGAACVGGDRNTGHIDRNAVRELKEFVESFE